MSFITRWFSKPKEEDYDTILSTLANNIKKRQVLLSEIRLRERRATLLVTLYTLAAWVAYVSLWYMNFLPNINGRNTPNSMHKALGALPVILGPIVVLFIRRIVQIWYSRKGDAEERTLQQLLKQQREKVEEIKKKTNYYSTRELLQRYDESSSSPPSGPGSPMQPQRASGFSQLPNQPQPPKQPAQPVTPQRPQQGRNVPEIRTPVSVNPALMQQLSPTSTTPLGPPRKQWLDKIVDLVLGDDANDSARFALICEKCFSHNGLVKESVWEETQYVCPKCKHFNPSKRSKKQGLAPSPSSPGSGLSPVPPTSPLFPRSSKSTDASPSSGSASPPTLTARSSSSTSTAPGSQPLRRQGAQPRSPLSGQASLSLSEEEGDESMMDVVEE